MAVVTKPSQTSEGPSFGDPVQLLDGRMTRVSRDKSPQFLREHWVYAIVDEGGDTRYVRRSKSLDEGRARGWSETSVRIRESREPGQTTLRLNPRERTVAEEMRRRGMRVEGLRRGPCSPPFMCMKPTMACKACKWRTLRGNPPKRPYDSGTETGVARETGKRPYVADIRLPFGKHEYYANWFAGDYEAMKAIKAFAARTGKLIVVHEVDPPKRPQWAFPPWTVKRTVWWEKPGFTRNPRGGPMASTIRPRSRHILVDQYGGRVPDDLVVLGRHPQDFDERHLRLIDRASWYEVGGIILVSAREVDYLSEDDPLDSGIDLSKPEIEIGRIADALKRMSDQDGFYHA